MQFDHSLRRRVVAWSDYSRELTAKQVDAGDQRASAMYDALMAGIPWTIVVADAGCSQQRADRIVRTWCERTRRPFPSLELRKEVAS